MIDDCRNMVTAVSNVNKLAATKYVATGAADGSICLLDLESGQTTITKVSIRLSSNGIGIQTPCCYN